MRIKMRQNFFSHSNVKHPSRYVLAYRHTCKLEHTFGSAHKNRIIPSRAVVQ